MKLIRVAAGVLNQTPLDWAGNFQNICDCIDAAREKEVSILCLPELCITGYGCEDAFHSPGVLKTAKEILVDIAKQTSGLVVSVGLPIFHAGGVFNTACLIADQKIIGFVGKQYLAGDGIHYEPRWFKRWPAGAAAYTDVGDQVLPIGDLVFELDDIKIGFEICEDAWVGDRPGTRLAARGVDVILNPSASHFAFGKHKVRKRFIIEGSRAFQVSYVYSNLVGNEAGRAIYDGDSMVATAGEVVTLGQRFSYKKHLMTDAIIDVETTRMLRARTGSFVPSVESEAEDLIKFEFKFPHVDPVENVIEVAQWESSEHKKQEEFTRAISLALFDYLRKSFSSGIVVSLSGGADSAACVMLSALMLKLSCDELGLEEVKNRLGHISGISDAENIEQLCNAMIFTVYQATENSSDTTRSAAKTVAEAVSANHMEFEINELVEKYEQIVSDGIGRKLTWETDDITLQNIQARVRSPSVWMLANIYNALLLSTSNRSEAAVGYATMDGDTSGGLAPIAGIDKAFLREWLDWMEKSGPNRVGPTPELIAINCQQPTAELRPLEKEQTDEGDLMPYPVLDEIEMLAIRDKLMPLEILKILSSRKDDVPLAQIGAWVDRFFKLWCRNQWKRERYAPSFHVDDKNLDPKTWCRFPILSGGFRRELQQMHDFIGSK